MFWHILLSLTSLLGSFSGSFWFFPFLRLFLGLRGISSLQLFYSLALPRRHSCFYSLLFCLLLNNWIRIILSLTTHSSFLFILVLLGLLGLPTCWYTSRSAPWLLSNAFFDIFHSLLFLPIYFLIMIFWDFLFVFIFVLRLVISWTLNSNSFSSSMRTTLWTSSVLLRH